MPYREAKYRASCHVCGALGRARCCKCDAPICAEHGRELSVQFYVPAVACSDEQTCRARAPERRTYDPGEEVATPWGMGVKRYLG